MIMYNNNMIYDCIIVGGGASGLMCAANLDLREYGSRGIILEGTDRLGTKLLMSGGGHCNITHAGSIKDMISCYGQNAGKARKLLYRHNNEEMKSFLGSIGIETVSDDYGRVFPETRKAEDVLNSLIDRIQNYGWEVAVNSSVCDFYPADGSDCYKIILENGRRYEARHVVFACGGITYPKTGSDGRMLRLLRDSKGIEVSKLNPALRPIEVDEYPYEDLAGLSVKGARITIKRHGAKDVHYEGDLLFSHNDFTGPVMLAASRDAQAGVSILINYVYDKEIKTKDEALEVLKSAASSSRKELATVAAENFGIPKRLAKMLEERAKSSAQKMASLLAEDDFKVKGLNNDSFDVIDNPEARRLLNKAMVTAGGVVMEKDCGVNPKTLELAHYDRCYVIGEMLDVDGETGGYNLQFAYSSACIVAEEISLHFHTCALL